MQLFLLKPDLYYENIAAICDMSLQHAMAGLYYLVARPVQLVENTHDANAQLAIWVSAVAMHVLSHVAMQAVAKVEPGSTFAMSRCDRGFPFHNACRINFFIV